MKFYVDYTRMYGSYARINKNSGVETMSESRDRIEKLQAQMGLNAREAGRSLLWDTAATLAISMFEKYGKNVVRVESDLAKDLMATECTVPVEAFKMPWPAFYVSFDRGLLPRERSITIGCASSGGYDGCYVYSSNNSIKLILVDSFVRSLSIPQQAKLIDKGLHQFLKQHNVTARVAQEMVAEHIVATVMPDGRQLFVDLDGFSTIHDALECRSEHLAKEHADAKRKFLDCDIFDIYNAEVAKLPHDHPSRALARVTAEQIADNLGLNVKSAMHDLGTHEISEYEALVLDPAAIRLVVNLCVYLSTGAYEKVDKTPIHRVRKTHKSISKHLKSGYDGSYIHVGKGYVSGISDVNTHNPLNINCWVRGHWRNQACGKGWSEHKAIYIKPFRKGTGEITDIKVKHVA